MRMLIKREQMRLEQTRHPTSSKKIDRTKKIKEETEGMYSSSSDNMAEWKGKQ